MKAPVWSSGLIALLLLSAGYFYLKQSSHPAENVTAPDQPSARSSADRALQTQATRDKAQEQLIRNEWAALQSWLDGNPPPSPEDIQARLHTLRTAWAQLDPHILAVTIDSLLQSNDNRLTGLPFAVGPQGFLSSWPDLRSFLVDALAIADPDESARIARSLLRDTDSSAEFALAIRSLTRGGDADADAPELLSCLNTLLGRREWQNDAAMMESLDLARYLGNTEAAATLLAWNGNPKARDMALHEFAADHPAVMISTLAENPVPSLSETTALLARADPADPDQAAAIDAYLRNPDIPLDHRKQFLSLYPLRSLTTGYRLYRGNPAPYDESSIRRSDQAALFQAEAWLKDPALAPLHDDLNEWKTQLLDWQKPDS